MKSNYIIVNGLKCHWNFKLLPKGFRAITLFGNIFFRDTKEKMEAHLATNNGKITINHERIHTLQAKSMKLGYFEFYNRYIGEWIKNLFKYGVKDDIAYYNISFEKEAYQNQKDFNYSESHWRDYKN